jgi:hypothetical protein
MIGGSERLLSPKFLMRLQIERPNRSNPRETKTRLSNGFIVPITPPGHFQPVMPMAASMVRTCTASKLFSNMGWNEDFVRALRLCASG